MRAQGLLIYTLDYKVKAEDRKRPPFIKLRDGYLCVCVLGGGKKINKKKSKEKKEKSISNSKTRRWADEMYVPLG